MLPLRVYLSGTGHDGKFEWDMNSNSYVGKNARIQPSEHWWMILPVDDFELDHTHRIEIVKNTFGVPIAPIEPYAFTWKCHTGQLCFSIRLIDADCIAQSGVSRGALKNTLGRALRYEEKKPYMLQDWNNMCAKRRALGRVVPQMWTEDDGAVKAGHEVLVKRVYGSKRPDLFGIRPNSRIVDAGAHKGYFI